ncbi:YkgJ family cysteine cluster protein [Geotalea sp. SG265]|uniref:YkgJ family cysteine cluster protein n=1 Tax=Geotalea sp. SG265 TaxID=2922867 RepID=UPI001FB00588|nr:YkgJ family cysteine cluster protein [Geotalea sp. SG265]
MECSRCGTCCVAPDISTLAKPLGVPCINLCVDCSCSRYGTRPAVCRSYRPDELCRLIDAPDMNERVEKYLQLFGLFEEVKRTSSG